ncbi:STAS domain-containing protein [Streptomyces sp. CA-252508]|uniref:STAS domain-containing protein n=1 Tax=Streptomyces sp. CA-252508 TaxID=3418946 RepID=UPI003D931858
MSTSISLTVQTVDHGSTALALAGELDLDSAARIEPDLFLATAWAGREVVVDMAGVTFCDTSGVELLMRLHRRCATEGCRLRLCRVPRQPGRVFRVLGVDRAIPCSFAG